MNLLYSIALTMINGVGGILARQLLNAFDSAEAIFKEKKQRLERVPGIGELLATEIQRPEVLRRAEQELVFIEKNQIRCLYIEDEEYPARLRECPDAPLLLYYKGTADLNAQHILSIVGTRHATRYGQDTVAQLAEGLAETFPDTLIISGLAYGIDVCAHRSALRNRLQTIGVLAHGLDRLYPPAHRQTAIEMLSQGGLLTDFPSQTNPDRPNFLKRNRIIAGLSDATLVVESARKGGSLVTAAIALSYNREVFAVPGRSIDMYSVGCNELIRRQQAGLVSSAADLIEALGWQIGSAPQAQQTELSFNDPPETARLVACLRAQSPQHMNLLAKQTGLEIAQLTNLLFELEMDGRIRSLPGNMYALS